MAQKQDTRTQLLTALPFQLMRSLSIPVIIGMVVVGLYNFMDRFFAGQLRGSSRPPPRPQAKKLREMDKKTAQPGRDQRGVEPREEKDG